MIEISQEVKMNNFTNRIVLNVIKLKLRGNQCNLSLKYLSNTYNKQNTITQCEFEKSKKCNHVQANKTQPNKIQTPSPGGPTRMEIEMSNLFFFFFLGGRVREVPNHLKIFI